MTLHAAQRRYSGLLASVALSAVLVCQGCESPSNTARPTTRAEIDPTKIQTRDDIVQIIQYWPQMPWLQESSRIIGFRVTVYFVSGQTEKGAFVPGNIFVWLYELEPRRDGGKEPKLAHVWEFNEATALGFRVTKRAIGGYFYGFPLRWPNELALEGKQIEIQFGYERTDKRVVLSAARRFHVPIPAGYRPPAEEPADETER